METKKTNKRKLATSGLALTLAVAVGLGGTMAWQATNQEAKNEAIETANPGGRLHDDFDGSNKDIYVENFTDPDDNGQNIFARVKLQEYLETGDGAGLKFGEDGYTDKKAKSIIETADINDTDTWTTYKYKSDNDLFRTYWTWDNDGGKTTYMPTFNMNKDSLLADINGHYDEVAADGETRYADYVDYTQAANQSKDGTEVWDVDRNTVDEYEDGTAPDKYKALADDGSNADEANVQLIKKTHTAKETLDATVMSMAEWLLLPEDQQTGDFWVWDTDGWAYWANPIKPGTATGLLLDKITPNGLDGNYYYGINVIAQFCTSDDWGKADNKGFFDTEKDPDKGTPSTNAQALLSKAAGQDVVKVSMATPTADNLFKYGYAIYDRTEPVTAADSGSYNNVLMLSAETNLLGASDSAGVTWDVTGNNSTSTKITTGTFSAYNNGKAGTPYLQVGTDETATELTVTATSKTWGVTGSMKVKVGSWKDTLKAAKVGTFVYLPSTTEGKADNAYVVLAQDTAKHKALVMKSSVLGGTAYYANSKANAKWSTSTMRTTLSTWLENQTALKGYAVETTLKTYTAVDNAYEETQDKVFLLDVPDINGMANINGSYMSVTDAQYYIFGNQPLLSVNDWLLKTSNSSYYLSLRSPNRENGSSYMYINSTSSDGSWVIMNHNDSVYYYRPVLWVDYEATP